MSQHIDQIIQSIIRSIRCRLEGGTVYLKIAESVIARGEDRGKAIDVMIVERALIEQELAKLNAAIAICSVMADRDPDGGA